MNRYTKALKQLKSTKIDSKIKKLEESPTNSTKGVYSLNPSGYRLGKPEPPTQFFPKSDGTWPDGVPGEDNELVYTRPGGFWDGGKNWESVKLFTPSQTDIGDDGKNTDGLIDADGTVKTFLPDGARGFVLGPLTDGYVPNHTYDAYTNIGYIQKDTRQFVILGRITGQWADNFYSSSGPTWDGTSNGFSSHNENFTLAMAQWMRTEILANRYYSNLPYFYSGGAPQAGIADCPTCPGGMYGGTLVGAGGDGSSLSGGGQSGGIGLGSGDDVTTGDEHTQGDPQSGDQEDAGGPFPGLGDLAWGGGNKDPKWPKPGTLSGNRTYKDAVLAQNGMYPGGEEAFVDKYGYSSQDAINSYQSGGTPQSSTGGDGPQVATSPFPSDPASDASTSLGVKPGDQIAASPNSPAPVNPKDIPTDPSSPYLPGKSPYNVATHDKPLSHYPAAGGADKWPGLPGTSLDLLHPSNKPLLNIPITPYGIRASGGNDVKVAGNYGSLKNWEKSILQNGLNTRTGASWERELRRLQQMYPGFVPRVKKPSTTSNTYVAHHEPQGKVLSESRRSKILREIKKPFEVPELPKKYKMNFKGKFTPQNTPDKTASKESDGLAAVANMRGHKWSQEDKYWAGYETTETMNVVYDKVGHGEQAWNRMIEGARQKNGWKNREIIEQLNIIAHEKASRKVNPDYQSPWVIKEASPEQIEKEKNFDRVNKIKQIIGDTKRGDIKPEYPDKPAVELGPDGYHPNYGKKYRHDKLDPDSAEAMPNTGNPEIDANVKKVSDVKRKARKLKTLLGKMR